MNLLLALLIACGGGSDGGGPDISPTQTKTYSVEVEQPSISLDINFNRISEIQVLKVTFNGDGLVVGYPPGARELSWLGVELTNVTTNSADLEFTTSGVRLYNLAILNTTLRLVTGKADGSTVVHKDIEVTINVNDGIEISTDKNYLDGTWGDQPISLDLSVETVELEWQLSSDNPHILFTPSSGAGRTTVKIDYDPKLMPVGVTPFNIIVNTTRGDTEQLNASVSLDAPYINALASLDIDVRKQDLTNRYPIPITLSNDVEVQWSVELPSWLDATQTTGITGQDSLEVFLNLDAIPDTEGVHSENINVIIDIPGAILNQTSDVTLKYAKKRLQPNRPIFAFSDHNTADLQQGMIVLNHPVDSLDVVTNSNWIVIDEKSNETITFHLETSDLDNGFYVEDILLGPENDDFLQQSKVTVSYYKTDASILNSTTYTIAEANHPVTFVSLSDKLGPWNYIVPSKKAAEENDIIINKFNTVTGQVDAEYKLNNIRYINTDSLKINNDGTKLYLSAITEDEITTIIIIDLLNNTISENEEFASFLSVANNYNFKLLNISGKNFFLAEILNYCREIETNTDCNEMFVDESFDTALFDKKRFYVEHNNLYFKPYVFDYVENALYTSSSKEVYSKSDDEDYFSGIYSQLDNQLYMFNEFEMSGTSELTSYSVDYSTSMPNIASIDSISYNKRFYLRPQMLLHDNGLVLMNIVHYDSQLVFNRLSKIVVVDKNLNEKLSQELPAGYYSHSATISADGKVVSNIEMELGENGAQILKFLLID